MKVHHMASSRVTVVSFDLDFIQKLEGCFHQGCQTHSDVYFHGLSQVCCLDLDL